MNNSIKIFKALGEETRFLIIKALMKKELCACQIPNVIKRTQSNTSMHLAKLRSAGIVKFRKDGKLVLYSIDNKDVEKIMEMTK